MKVKREYKTGIITCIASVTGIYYYYYLSDSYISVCGSVYGQLTYIHISASQGLLTEVDGELIMLLIVVPIHLGPALEALSPPNSNLWAQSPTNSNLQYFIPIL